MTATDHDAGGAGDETARSGTATARLGGPTGSDDPIELYWTRHDPEGGPGRPLLLVNGLGSPLVAYEDGFVAQFTARGFSVVRFDNRDVGRSSRIAHEWGDKTAPYDLVDMANDAMAVLDAVGWDRAHVFGQSMGGMIAQQVAISHPDRVLSLISVMSSTGNPTVGRATPEAYQGLMKAAPRDPAAWLDHRVETERIWASPAVWDPERARAKGRALLEHGIDVDGTGRHYRAIVASGNRDDALAALDMATLVLHGSADTLIQPDGGRHTAAIIPGARFVEIDGYGHDLAPEFWERLASEVAGFVADIER